MHVHEPGATAAFFGVAVRAGSRDESADHAGLAHFVEHTIFKGTQRRSAWHIINRMEAIGGELNAFTTKEETVVYTAFPARGGGLARATDLVADLIINSRFPDAELAKERQVVADEIDSYLDQPAEAVYDDFEDLIFAGHPLGHNILGTPQTLSKFTSAECRTWLADNYTARRMVAFYSGNAGVETFRRHVEANFASLSAGVVATPHCPVSAENSASPFQIHRSLDTHQSHTVVGCALPAMDLSARTATALLANILGGPGMNSLLNVQLRERRGLVYTVEANTAFFSDCGEFTIYYGCDPDDNAVCHRLVLDTLHRLATHELTPRQLAAARRQYLGQVTVARGTSREDNILSIARATLMHGHARTAAEVAADIAAVTPAQLAAAARQVANPSTLTLGQ